ncbi:MAG: M56 family metallopeptidase, partial [Erythrobacter sp.]
MTQWLFDTLIWTGALVALVLVLRRAVARAFGPQVAYALWALPALRLLLPPIELPAWMAPASAVGHTDPVDFAPSSEIAPASGGEHLAPVSPGQFEASASEGAQFAHAIDGAMIDAAIAFALAGWLVGAAIFLVLRFTAYFRLRDELLAAGLEVGRCENVRLVETPGTKAPLAFGVIDKVVALPPGFLAQPDRTARDLAIAHEMAHHRGRDLLVNVLIQPLFAMHWFTPLGHFGWLALRRDQEAACDARVVAARPAAIRQAYADLIVSFAAGPKIALAAPMACPVLGEKSIIHRLRSLNMTETSTRRRLTGRVLLATGLLALPLTASISYASSDTRVVAPEAPPAPPSPTSTSLAPPAPPSPPQPPVAPPAPASLGSIQSIDPVVEVDERPDVRRDQDRRTERRQDRREEQRQDRRQERQTYRYTVMRDGERLSGAEREAVMEEVRAGLAEAERALDDLPELLAEAMAEAEALQGRTVVRMECSTDEGERSHRGGKVV